MEARNGSAGYGNKHHRKDGIRQRIERSVMQPLPKLRNCRLFDIHHYHYAKSHDQQADAEYGIDLSNNLVYGK